MASVAMKELSGPIRRATGVSGLCKVASANTCTGVAMGIGGLLAVTCPGVAVACTAFGESGLRCGIEWLTGLPGALRRATGVSRLCKVASANTRTGVAEASCGFFAVTCPGVAIAPTAFGESGVSCGIGWATGLLGKIRRATGVAGWERTTSTITCAGVAMAIGSWRKIPWPVLAVMSAPHGFSGRSCDAGLAGRKATGLSGVARTPPVPA